MRKKKSNEINKFQNDRHITVWLKSTEIQEFQSEMMIKYRSEIPSAQLSTVVPA